MSTEPEEVLRMPVISTGHITQETAEKVEELAEGAWPLETLLRRVDPVRYGYLLTVSLEPYEEHQKPEDLRILSEWAQKQGFRKVLLDTDGQQVEGLPFHDW